MGDLDELLIGILDVEAIGYSDRFWVRRSEKREACSVGQADPWLVNVVGGRFMGFLDGRIIICFKTIGDG